MHAPAVYRAILLALLATLVPSGAQAGGFSVLPTRIQFSAERGVQSVLLTNTSAQTVSVESQVLVWPEGAPGQLASDVVVTPAVVTLPPGQRMRVRVGLLRAGDGKAERAYRLYFTELPAPTPLQGAGIGVRLQLGLPVFVAPRERQPQALQWRRLPQREGSDVPLLEVFNPGNVHANLVQARVASGADQWPLNLTGLYVLAGLRLQVSLPQELAARNEAWQVRWMDGEDAREAAVAPKP